MEHCFNLANLLSFVQIAVVFNFGLFFLRGKNTFKEVCAEFDLYLGSLAKGCLNNSIKEVRRVRKAMPEDIRAQKEKTHKYYRLLKALLESKEKDFFILPCIGLFSGTYSLLFLFSGGLSGWKYDGLITDTLLVMAQIVLMMNIVSFLQLRKRTAKGAREKDVRYIIMINVVWFILLCLIAFLLVSVGWVYPFFNHIDYAVLTFVILTVYFPAILLVLMSLKKMIFLIYCQYMCSYHTKKLREMLD